MVLVIDAQVAGISGDMALCALVDMGADAGRVADAIRGAAGPFGGARVGRVEFVRARRGGLAATALDLEVDGGGGSRPASEVRACIAEGAGRAGLSEPAARMADEAAGHLVAAEARVHGVPESSARLHEAACFDTVADILGAAAALDDLGLAGGEAVCTPAAVGGGTVEFSHGTASNPAGAVLEILRGTGLRIRGTGAGAELTTPTGACLLRAMAGRCVEFYPPMDVGAVGYGAGSRDHAGFPNVLKLVRGDGPGGYAEDTVAVLETGVDDATGEVMGHAIGALMDAGARDVAVAPAVGKKGRPAHLVTVVCDPGSAGELARLLMAETGTLGVRARTTGRITARRESGAVSVRAGGRDFTVRVKRAGGRCKPEYEDVRAAAEAAGVPLGEVDGAARAAAEGAA